MISGQFAALVEQPGWSHSQLSNAVIDRNTSSHTKDQIICLGMADGKTPTLQSASGGCVMGQLLVPRLKVGASTSNRVVLPR